MNSGVGERRGNPPRRSQTSLLDICTIETKEVMMNWNKEDIRETMLSLQTSALHSARDNYLNYLSTARLDATEPIENDEQAEVAPKTGSS